MKFKSVYVASSWRNILQVGVVTALRAAGLTVYDYRQPRQGVSGFSWSNIAPDWSNWTPRQWRAALSHPIAAEGYANDFLAMREADCGVLVLPCGRSAHLEAGWMAGQGKPVFTLVLEKCEPELMALLLGPPENICCSMDDLFDRLEIPNAD